MIDWNALASDAKLLDLFAAHALTGLLADRAAVSRQFGDDEVLSDIFANTAYVIAQKMMEERDRLMMMNAGRR